MRQNDTQKHNNCMIPKKKWYKKPKLEQFGFGIWRRTRDSNPRYRFCPYAPLAGVCLRPLGQFSVRKPELYPRQNKVSSLFMQSASVKQKSALLPLVSLQQSGRKSPRSCGLNTISAALVLAIAPSCGRIKHKSAATRFQSQKSWPSESGIAAAAADCG